MRLVGSGLICTCTKAGKFQAMGGETLGKSSCFLLEMGHQGAAFLTPNKRYRLAHGGRLPSSYLTFSASLIPSLPCVAAVICRWRWTEV